MSDYPPRVAELLEDISYVEDRNDRLMMLIDFADRFQEVPPTIAERPFPEAHRVQRCESEAYVWIEERPDGTLKLHFAVENPQGISAKAMAVILDETLSGETAEEINKIDTDLVLRIFGKDLSMGKGQGLMGMVELTKVLAKRSLLGRP
ncbi:MAG: SufE family protein [Vulcanimicrobiota bacterium]